MNRNGSNSTQAISETAVPESSGRPDGTVANSGSSLVPVVRRGGGPRTLQGKQRSSRNAIKRGFFAKAALIRDESKTELKNLSKSVYKASQPVGALEELEVDRIVGIIWCERRTLRAQAGEIEFQREYGERPSQPIKVDFGDLMCSPGGLMGPGMDDQNTKGAVALLQTLKKGIEANGFDVKNDNFILAELYGSRHQQQGWDRDLRPYYCGLAATASLPEDVRKRQGLSTPAECQGQFLKILIDLERKLTRENDKSNAVDFRRMELESLRRGVPDSPRLDSILRSHTTLERSLDKALSRLERLQAKRLGQPVLPPIKLDISSSS